MRDDEPRPVWMSLPIRTLPMFFFFLNSPNERECSETEAEVDGGEEPDRRRGAARAC